MQGVRKSILPKLQIYESVSTNDFSQVVFDELKQIDKDNWELAMEEIKK